MHSIFKFRENPKATVLPFSPDNGLAARARQWGFGRIPTKALDNSVAGFDT
jgi:hypothetical protein